MTITMEMIIGLCALTLSVPCQRADFLLQESRQCPLQGSEGFILKVGLAGI